jgi:hypothetical protein
MKALFATVMMLASTVSVWAQGQIVITGSVCGEVFIMPGVALAESDIEIAAHTINLTDVTFQAPILDLQSFQPPITGGVNFVSAVTYGGGSSGAEMIGLSRPMPVISTYPIFPSSPDFVFQPDQAGVLQAVPEPSTVALGVLALGLIALARLKKRSCA